MAVSEDGKKWTQVLDGRSELLGPVKVGVFAESTAPEVLKAVFDQFKLTK